MVTAYLQFAMICVRSGMFHTHMQTSHSRKTVNMKNESAALWRIWTPQNHQPAGSSTFRLANGIAAALVKMHLVLNVPDDFIVVNQSILPSTLKKRPLFCNK